MRRWIAGAAVALAAAAAVFWLRSGGEPYPPKYNDDGTVDYTLMAGEPGDYSWWWILRFPQSIAVEPSKPLSGTFTIPGSGTTTIRTGYNEDLRIYFKLPGLEPWPAGTRFADVEGTPTLRVVASALSIDGFGKLFEAELQDCEQIDRVGPRTTAYRQRGNESSDCFVTDVGGEPYVGFVITSAAGQIIASVECPERNFRTAVGSCWGEIRPPNLKRMLLLYFNKPDLPPDDLEEIVLSVAKYIEEATVRVADLKPGEHL